MIASGEPSRLSALCAKPTTAFLAAARNDGAIKHLGQAFGCRDGMIGVRHSPLRHATWIWSTPLLSIRNGHSRLPQVRTSLPPVCIAHMVPYADEATIQAG